MHNVIQCERCLKTVLRDGIHTCTPTAGWLKLEQQLAAEREAREKAVAELQAHKEMLRQEMRETNKAHQRAESAEQKLREAQEQKPIAWRVPYEGSETNFVSGLPTNDTIHYWKSRNVELEYAYAAPIPPADIEELQRERDEFHALLKEKIRVTDELIRKLDNEWLAILRIVLA